LLGRDSTIAANLLREAEEIFTSAYGTAESYVSVVVSQQSSTSSTSNVRRFRRVEYDLVHFMFIAIVTKGIAFLDEAGFAEPRFNQGRSSTFMRLMSELDTSAAPALFRNRVRELAAAVNLGMGNALEENWQLDHSDPARYQRLLEKLRAAGIENPP
jgi:hypothetical protein